MQHDIRRTRTHAESSSDFVYHTVEAITAMTSPFASSSKSTPAPLFKKKRARGGETATATTSKPLSRRSDSDDDDANPNAGPSVVHKARKVDYSNPLIQSTGLSLAKRRAKERADAYGSDDDDGDEYTNVSARAKAGPDTSARSGLGADATRTVDWYDDEGDNGQSKGAAANNDDGVYRGMNAYSSAITTDPLAAKNKYTQRGPIKAPTNIRTVTVVDYQPDVCKDYKETGYCGFGDTCKFLHDRSDYLAGWQMEAAYLPNSTARDLGQDDAAEDSDEEEVPFACLICRQPFTDPIQTKCGHYFCSACAIKRFAKTPKCFACGAQTGGIFNSATKVIQRMESRRRQKEEDKAQRRAEWGQGQGDEEADGGELLDGVDVAGHSDSE